MNEPVREKTNNLGSDEVRHKPGCTVTEDGERLEILDLKVEELYYPCSENKGAEQLRSYCEADLHLCFRLCRLLVFPCGGSNSFQHRSLNLYPRADISSLNHA